MLRKRGKSEIRGKHDSLEATSACMGICLSTSACSCQGFCRNVPYRQQPSRQNLIMPTDTKIKDTGDQRLSPFFLLCTAHFPKTQYKMTKLRNSKAEEKFLFDINDHDTLLSTTRHPGLATNLKAEVCRAFRLLDLAGKDDNTAPAREVTDQAMREFYKARLAIRQAEQALKNLIPVLHQKNDELGENLTWPEHWYLNQTAFTLCMFLT